MKRTIIVALFLVFSGCQKNITQSSDNSQTKTDSESKDAKSNKNVQGKMSDTASETISPPSVLCGSETCVTGDSGKTCCLSAEGTGISSPQCRQDCKVVNQIKTYQALCDEHTDCEGSQLCCVTGGKYTFIAECKEPNLCNWTDSSGGSLEVCKSPGIESALSCSKGTACTKTVPGYSDWLFCELPNDSK